MPRPTTVRTFYNNYGETITTTIAKFLEMFPDAYRTSLNNRRGTQTEPGVWWRVDKEPVIVKQRASSGQIQEMYVSAKRLADPELSDRRRKLNASMMASYARHLEWRSIAYKTQKGNFIRINYLGDDTFEVYRNGEYEMTFNCFD